MIGSIVKVDQEKIISRSRKESGLTDREAQLSEALRDAARWLQSAGDTCGLQSLRDAAARAQATLAEVAHG